MIMKIKRVVKIQLFFIEFIKNLKNKIYLSNFNFIFS